MCRPKLCVGRKLQTSLRSNSKMDGWDGKETQRTFGSVTPPGSSTRSPPEPPPTASTGGGDDGLAENGSQSDEHEGDSESSDSSDTSNTSSSSSGGGGSTTSNSTTATTASNGLFYTDEYGDYLNVNCANNEGRMYLNRFARGSRGRCVLFRGRWITPNEFQAVSGRQSSKDWKRSIRMKGRCLKDYIGQGLFKEHLKSCSCKICSGCDPETLKQEGEMALAAKRRRLSQTDGGGGSSAASVPSSLEATPTAAPPTSSSTPSVGTSSAVLAENTSEGRLPGGGVEKRKRRGRPPKIQRVWSPSGGMQVPRLRCLMHNS